MNARLALRACLLLCLLGVGACAGTETGNPDLATGGVGAHPAIGEGGNGGGRDGGASSDAGITPSADGGGPHGGSDAGTAAQDAGGADFDGGVTDPPDDDAGAR